MRRGEFLVYLFVVVMTEGYFGSYEAGCADKDTDKPDDDHDYGD